MNEKIYPLQFKESDLENGNVNPDGTANFGGGNSDIIMLTAKTPIYEETSLPDLDEIVEMSNADAVDLIKSGKRIFINCQYVTVEEESGEEEVDYCLADLHCKKQWSAEEDCYVNVLRLYLYGNKSYVIEEIVYD